MVAFAAALIFFLTGTNGRTQELGGFEVDISPGDYQGDGSGWYEGDGDQNGQEIFQAGEMSQPTEDTALWESDQSFEPLYWADQEPEYPAEWAEEGETRDGSELSYVTEWQQTDDTAAWMELESAATVWQENGDAGRGEESAADITFWQPADTTAWQQEENPAGWQEAETDDISILIISPALFPREEKEKENAEPLILQLKKPQSYHDPSASDHIPTSPPLLASSDPTRSPEQGNEDRDLILSPIPRVLSSDSQENESSHFVPSAQAEYSFHLPFPEISDKIKISVNTDCSVFPVSFRIDDREIPWYWVGHTLTADLDSAEHPRLVTLTAIVEGNALYRQTWSLE